MEGDGRLNLKAMFSSDSDMWETPKDLFEDLNKEFNFNLDVCATKENAKCNKYYSPEDDGLSKPWDGNVWCNPPYGRDVWRWVRAGSLAAQERRATVVMLLPARTDTKWFHEYVYQKHEVRFIKGRLKFGESKNSAPFPSMIVVFRSKTMAEQWG